MHRKAALATAGALTATLFSGVVAVGATTGLLNSVDPGGPGHERLLDAASSARAKKILMIVDDPAPATGGSSARRSSRARTTWAPASGTAGAWSANTGSAPRTARQSPTAPRQSTTTTEPGEPEPPAPPPIPAAPAAPAAPPPTTSGPYNCSGSDDGMSEAYKQAREAYCQGKGGDD